VRRSRPFFDLSGCTSLSEMPESSPLSIHADCPPPFSQGGRNQVESPPFPRIHLVQRGWSLFPQSGLMSPLWPCPTIVVLFAFFFPLLPILYHIRYAEPPPPSHILPGWRASVAARCSSAFHFLISASLRQCFPPPSLFVGGAYPHVLLISFRQPTLPRASENVRRK